MTKQNKLKIGVFDSGIGGLSVVNAIKKAFPEAEVIFRNDSEHVPYGTKTLEQIYTFTKPVLEKLVYEDKCDVLVIACNTVSTNFANQLRQEFNLPIIAMEPMVKPAARDTKSKVIAVCATPRTLQSQRYNWLKVEFAQGVTVLEPDCSDWSYMIENDQINSDKIAKIVNDVCNQGADEIVLGCTHYHWIEALVVELAAGRAAVLQPEEPVVQQIRRVIERTL